MKEKEKKLLGFTLIELLAVIVILAVIILIATPIVLNIIHESKKKSFEISVENIVRAAELAYFNNTINGISKNLEFKYENGDAVSESLKFKGKNPKDGIITVNNEGNVAVAVHDGTWCAIKEYSDAQVKLIKLETDNCKLGNTSENPIVNDFDEAKGVNRPKLANGMIPIKWDENNVEIETNELDPAWYDYSQKKWANAKTKDGSYWVWIPRYAYKITSGYHSWSGRVNIKFLKEKSNDSVDGTVIEPTPIFSGDKQTNYVKHPAFTFGDDELTGFWAAKFETSVANHTDPCYTNANQTNCNKKTLIPKIIPNVKSWRYISIGNAFDVSIDMKNKTDIYGWQPTEIDTHMMKNTEWGAVSYLSNSNYGIVYSVWVNTADDYTTGCAGNSSTEITTGCLNSYNTTNGVKASTTHTIYGVYDMAGGAPEKVAAYIANDATGKVVHNNFLTYGLSMINADNKYKDIYIKGATDTDKDNYSRSANMYGDAVYETSADYSSATWYGSAWGENYSDMPANGSPGFNRGDGYYGDVGAGLFAFGPGPGTPIQSTFRPVVVINN